MTTTPVTTSDNMLNEMWARMGILEDVLEIEQEEQIEARLRYMRQEVVRAGDVSVAELRALATVDKKNKHTSK